MIKAQKERNEAKDKKSKLNDEAKKKKNSSAEDAMKLFPDDCSTNFVGQLKK